MRIYNNILRVEKEKVEAFRGLPVTNIADCMGRISCIDQSIRLFNRVSLLGSAFTIKVPCGDNLMLHKAIELAQAGNILVVNVFGRLGRSLCGPWMIETARQKGILGFVIEGCVRDCDDISKFDNFSCYARGIQPNGSYKNGPGEINVPVAIGDQNGLVVISPKDTDIVAAAAHKVFAAEEKRWWSTLRDK